MKYAPLHCHTHFSLLEAASHPHHIISRLNENEFDSCAITDYGSISGCVDFLSAMQKGKKKAILGTELYITDEHVSIKSDNISQCSILAKNTNGWRNLIKLTSEANNPEHFYKLPRLSLEQVADHAKDLVAYTGQPDSTLAKVIFKSDNTIDPDWKVNANNLIGWHKDTFGSDFYLATQLVNKDNNPEHLILAEMIRELATENQIPVIAVPDAHYSVKSQAVDQRVLLCNKYGTTLNIAGGENYVNNKFFRSENYHIPSYEEMIEYGYTAKELAQTLEVAASIADYSILSSPILAPFKADNGMPPDEYLRYLCREGWRRLIERRVPKEKHGIYADRIKHELSVLQGAGLSSYFLIVQDILQYVRSNGWLPGPGRGSAAGCLVSYLIGITSIDPIEYDLIFERFYNAGRNTAGHIEMPDIDVDIPVCRRKDVINYIIKKYGSQYVSQMVTYQTIKGRGAIKTVFRAHGAANNETVNRITKGIPQEASIADELQKMKELTGESSILMWTLENTPDVLSEWCKLDDDGKLTGQFAPLFEQAIRLEGTKSNQSKHASGIAIAPVPLDSICPMIYDSKSRVKQAGLEMNALAAIGILKLDILGVAVLDKAQGVAEILRTDDVLYCDNEAITEYAKAVQTTED